MHVSTNNCSTHKLESTLLELGADFVRQLGSRGDVFRPAVKIVDRLAVHKAPQPSVEAAVFLLYPPERPRVGNYCADFLPVADNVRILQKLVELCVVIAGDFLCIKAVKGSAIILAPSQRFFLSHPRFSIFPYVFLLPASFRLRTFFVRASPCSSLYTHAVSYVALRDAQSIYPIVQNLTRM